MPAITISKSSQSGGVPEGAAGTLSALPFPVRISARIEDYAIDVDTQHSFPLLGLDLIAEGEGHEDAASSFHMERPEDALKFLGQYDSVWVGQSLGHKAGDRIKLLINDQVREYTVRGVYPDANGNAAAIVMDLAAAQVALNRFGRVDRILVKVPPTASLEEWQQRLQGALPAGVEVRPAGTGTDENRRMLAAFRWNLRLLSYIALVVGAFLIYNTISVSVVRRRAEIGIVRALGASRGAVLAAFLGEAASFGLIGALLGLPLGRLMASGAVRLMSATVEALVCQQQARIHRAECRRGADRDDHWNRSFGSVGVFAGTRSVACTTGRSDGARQAGIHRARSQDARSMDRCAARTRRGDGFARSRGGRQAAVRLSRHVAADRCVGAGGPCFSGCDHAFIFAVAWENPWRGSCPRLT